MISLNATINLLFVQCFIVKTFYLEGFLVSRAYFYKKPYTLFYKKQEFWARVARLGVLNFCASMLYH